MDTSDWDFFKDKLISVFMNDTTNSVIRKDGFIFIIGEENIILQNQDSPILIPKAKIVRIEVLK